MSVSPLLFTISDTNLNGPVAISFFILLNKSLTIFLSCTNFRHPTPTLAFIYPKRFPCSKASHNGFLKLFFNAATHCQHTIIIPYTMFPSNNLISFEHHLYNLNHLSFLTVSPTNICKLFLLCVFLFSLFLKFMLFNNAITDIIILPIYFPVPSWAF